MCGTSLISPSRLVLSIAVWTPDVQLLKVRQNMLSYVPPCCSHGQQQVVDDVSGEIVSCNMHAQIHVVNLDMLRSV